MEVSSQLPLVLCCSGLEKTVGSSCRLSPTIITWSGWWYRRACTTSSVFTPDALSISTKSALYPNKASSSAFEAVAPTTRYWESIHFTKVSYTVVKSYCRLIVGSIVLRAQAPRCFKYSTL
ncbi:hypothetical protein BCR34DRAFT_555818 [Clohesyomyces aquaticus]|uniref:Uncharacterized protein n=1 Tax=Clohesyomyces aquaticus TaxID=1231657 RepID=A0A1Y2A4N0_9PLEO|nr:hypothetical protein BCR34DRAFT_555818 [Clohesyomyces aquaticus]